MGLWGDLFGDNEGSEEAAKVARDNLAWQKDMAAKDQETRNEVITGLQPDLDYANTTDRSIIDTSLKNAEVSTQRGNTLWDQYMNEVVPVQSKYYKEALDYGGTADQERAAGMAVSDVRQQYGTQKGINERNLASIGVNPNSGRFASADRTAELAAMAAAAGGATKARTTARDTGIQLRGDATKIGQSLVTGAQNFNTGAVSNLNLGGSLTNNAVNRGLAVGNYKVGGTANAMNSVSNAANNTASALQNTDSTGLLPGLVGFGAAALTAPSTSWIGQKMTSKP